MRKSVFVAALLTILVVILGTARREWFSTSTRELDQPAPPTTLPDTVLDETQRQYIWQVEHHVLLLTKYWFHDLRDALAKGDGEALLAMVAPDFSATQPRQPNLEKIDNGFVQVKRYKDAGHGSLPLDRRGFVAFIMSYRALFSQPPRVKVYPKTMAPDSREDLDCTWRGAGVLRMWGRGLAGELAEVVLQIDFRLPRPRPRHEGGWLQHLAVTQIQQAQSPGFLLRDATRERNLDPSRFYDNWTMNTSHGVTGGVYLCDFNRDGIIDLLVVDLQRLALYKGMPGGKFQDVTAELGLPEIPPPTMSSPYAAFVDLDGDGWEDLILLSRVYRNENGKRFSDYTQRTNLRFPPGTSGISSADYDGDGKMDLYVNIPGQGKTQSWLNGDSGEEQPNQLWRNLGDWKFAEVAAKSNAGGGRRSVFSAVWLDANNDGKPDLYVPNEFGNGVLLINRGDGTFREEYLVKGPGDFGTMGLTCGDIDNDGNIDLYLGNMYSKTGSRIVGNLRPGTYSEDIMAKMRRFVSGSQLYLNHGAKGFQPVGETWQINDVGWAYGPAFVDLDNDGFLDLFATSGFISRSRDEPDG